MFTQQPTNSSKGLVFSVSLFSFQSIFHTNQVNVFQDKREDRESRDSVQSTVNGKVMMMSH